VVCDSKGQCAQEAKTVTVINRPPTANFDWSPKPVYEGDSVTFTTSINDPDRDPLNVTYVITAPNGSVKTFNYTRSYPYSTAGPTLTMAEVGNWSVRLTVTDGLSDPVTVTKTVSVLDLSITGQVRHTDSWESYRLAYNAKYPSKKRDPNVFWAGEAFVLGATVTNTGSSSTKPTSVVARLVQTGHTSSMNSSNQMNYTGEMLDTMFKRLLDDGTYIMRFTVTWSNGHIETDDVPFIIRGTIDDVIVVQNRH
jgi:hypothetical protein